jgi:undecaprenyl-diphosphatase
MKSINNEIKLTLIGLVLLFAVMPFDTQILAYEHAHAYCRPFYDFITDFALGKWYILPSGALFVLGFAFWKLKKLPTKLVPAFRGITLFFFAVAGAGIVTDILKYLVARARPIEYTTHHISGIFHWHEAFHGADKAHFVSFPSGHSTTAFAVATAISLLLPEKLRALRILAYVFALLLAYSRLMVEAHYASDVVAGMLIGCWGAIAARNYLARAKWFAAST